MPKKTGSNPITQNIAPINRGIVVMRQAGILQNMVENGGNSGRKASISTSARSAGYSEAYIKSGKLQKTKAWKELLNESFPDEKVVSVHLAQLEANKLQQVPFPSEIKDAEIKQVLESQGYTFIATKRLGKTAYVFFSIPDNMARLNALDKVYKIKNRYHDTHASYNKLSILSDTEIEEEAAKIIFEALEISSIS